LCNLAVPINYESYNYTLNHAMSQGAWIKQITGGRGLWPVGGYMMYMYTDLDLEHHSHLSTTINPTSRSIIILTYARRSDWYLRAYPSILHGTVKMACFSWGGSTSGHHNVIRLNPH